jgi:hypothetical protein
VPCHVPSLGSCSCICTGLHHENKTMEGRLQPLVAGEGGWLMHRPEPSKSRKRSCRYVVDCAQGSRDSSPSSRRHQQECSFRRRLEA